MHPTEAGSWQRMSVAATWLAAPWVRQYQPLGVGVDGSRRHRDVCALLGGSCSVACYRAYTYFSRFVGHRAHFHCGINILDRPCSARCFYGHARCTTLGVGPCSTTGPALEGLHVGRGHGRRSRRGSSFSSCASKAQSKLRFMAFQGDTCQLTRAKLLGHGVLS